MDPTEITVAATAALASLGTALFFFGPRCAAPAQLAPDGRQEIELLVEGGYRPDRVVLKAGQPARLTVLRTDHSACSEDLVLGDLGVTRRLPTGRPVVIDLPALPPGEHEFTCGMRMMRGRIRVEA